MSVQLILYPQNQATNNEFLVNGLNFTGLSTSTLYNTTAGLPSQDAIINSPPTIPNTWYRYTTTGGGWGTVAPPLAVSNNLLLFFNVTAGRTGIYQKLSGLTIGQSYTATINISTSAVGVLRIKTYTGSILQSTTTVTANATQATAVFVANSANDTILLEYISVDGVVGVSDISVIGSAPINTYEGQVILDLYEDEDIPLTLSVDNFKNVAEKVQSYSKSFNLPATKRNNQIFTNLFEVTMVQDVFSFNPYLKTPCVLKQNGFILFEGYLRLIDIEDKEAEISYNVNLYSEVIALADALENKTFQDIDFNELTHLYNKDTIKNSWDDGVGLPLVNSLPTSSLAYDATIGVDNTNVLKYPFVDWSHNYTLDASTGYPILPNLESSFRPFINIKYLIGKIFSDTDFTYTSDFFDTTDFGKLFMDFNWGGNSFPVPEAITLGLWGIPTGSGISSNIGNSSWKDLQLIPESINTFMVGSEVPPNYQNSGANIYKIVATTDNETYQINYRFPIQSFASSPNDVELRWVKNEGLGTEQVFNYTTWSLTGTQMWNGWGLGTVISLDTGDTLSPQFKANSNVKQGEQFVGAPFATRCSFVRTTNQVEPAGLLTLRGELGQWEFLKGILTMFNLVSMPDKDNPRNIIFEPYADIFITNTAGTNLAARSIQHDWTDKIDVSQMKLTPLIDLNKTTIFKFVEDDDDYAFNLYKQSVGGHLYGSKVFDASGLNLLQGKDEIVAEPFAATVSKTLWWLFSSFIVPTLYAMNDDGTSEAFDNSPRILYNNGTKDTGITYFIPDQNGLNSEDQPEFLQFSHLTDVPTISGTRDFHFGECQLIPPIGDTVPDNLFNLYWLAYYNELYNPNTRTMSLKVNLSPSDINLFNMSDKVFIKNRTYRVNKIDYKPNDLATVEFILIP